MYLRKEVLYTAAKRVGKVHPTKVRNHLQPVLNLYLQKHILMDSKQIFKAGAREGHNRFETGQRKASAIQKAEIQTTIQEELEEIFWVLLE